MTDLYTGEIDRLTDGNRIARPPVSRDRRGRWQRADAGEWDWFYGLPESERQFIRSHYMVDQGVEPDIVADWHGLSVDEAMGQWVAAIRGARNHAISTVDPLDDGWLEIEEPEPDDVSSYDDEMGRFMVTELVGPVEIAQRAGVSVSAVAHWRRRHDDFPKPIAEIGAGRHSPRGTESNGTPIWDWPKVAAWLELTGRTR